MSRWRLHAGIVVLLTGCSLHLRPAPVADPMFRDEVVDEARHYVAAIADKMPDWDGDVVIAQYEGAEIARVKADIRLTRDSGTPTFFS